MRNRFFRIIPLLETCSRPLSSWLLCLGHLIAGLVAPVTIVHAQFNASNHEQLIRFSGPEELRYDDLVKLATIDPPPADAQAKLDRLFQQPFISNEATFAGVKPLAPVVPGVGAVLRIAEWNINRTSRVGDLKLALTDEAGFLAAARANSKLSPADLRKTEEQIRHLRAADVLVLDEIDDGVARMNYENVPRELAQALHMNYVFGVEFAELNGIVVHRHRAQKQNPLSRDDDRFGDDPARDRGMEGSAMLSRYPIRDATVIRLPSEYDWYHGEIKALSELQRMQKWSSEKLFDQRIKRQVRRGGRIALLVNIEVPQSPTGVITIVCPHLEDYTDPRGRRAEADYLLEQLPLLSNPVIVAGDFNTMGHNAHPQTFKQGFIKSLTSLHFWLAQGLFFLTPIPGLGYVLYPVNYFKNSHDPTAVNIPILAPNREQPLFHDVHEFHFADGSAFLWHGDKNRSLGQRGRTLSDTNQRAWKGFAPTFFFAKTYHGLVGTSKIDWFFVKPESKDRQVTTEPFPLAPFFGRTLPQVNTALGKRISDHCPTTLDIVLKALRTPTTLNP